MLTSTRTNGTPVMAAFTRLTRYDLAAIASLPWAQVGAIWRGRIALPLAILAALFLVTIIGSVVARRAQRREADAHAAAEARVRAADARLAIAVEGGKLATWEYDLTTGSFHFERGWNEHIRLPLDGARMTWQEFALLLRPTDIAGWDEKAIKLLKGEVEFFYEAARIQERPGVWRWIVVRGRVAARDAMGRVLRCAGTANDDTERQQAREAKEAARLAAEAASRAKSDFIDRLSLEVRTPINGVLGMTELLASTASTPHQEQLMSAIRNSGESLLQVVDDLLDYSRIEAGTLQLEPVSFELRGVIDATLQPLYASAQNKGLGLSCEVAADVPARVRADLTRLAQVLSHVVDNALKFTAEGRVSIKVMATARTADSVTLHFSVVDTGIGIVSEAQQTIFDAFVQGDRGPARKYGGTGLGLALCKELLKLLDGDIEFASVPGAGSVFQFTMKVGVEAEAAHAPVAPQAAQPAKQPKLAPGLRVLLVEDVEINRAVARGMLKILKCEVDIAVDGEEAVASSAAKPYDAVLMDCHMPGMDGMTATTRIREREKESNAPRLPIIALTANVAPGSREECINAGMDDYITKPISLDSLEQTISRWAPRGLGL